MRLLATAMTVVAVPALPMAAALAEPQLIPAPRYGVIDGAAVGYIGCVATDRFDDIFCFSANASEPGSLKLAVRTWRDGSSVPTDVEAIDPAGSLVVFTDEFNRTAVRLRATVPDLGSVDLNAHTQSPFARSSGNSGCPLYPLHWELLAETPAIAGVWGTTGTVAGEVVANWSICDAFFIARTSGAWWMASGL